jgi:transposase-like protein
MRCSSAFKVSYDISGAQLTKTASCSTSSCRGGAAKRVVKRLLKGLEYTPRVLITDKLRSYVVAKRELLPDVEHRESRYLNNRAENSHWPTRRRERQMQRSNRCARHSVS